MNLPLNIDFQQIFLHFFNFVLLFAILYFLLYKPVKDFMDKRTEYYKKLDEEAKQKLADAQKTKEKYADKLAAAEEEISAKGELMRREAEEVNQMKVKQAEEEAAKIIAEARKSIEKDRAKMITEAQTELSDMVIHAAEKLVIESSTSDAYDRFLDSVNKE